MLGGAMIPYFLDEDNNWDLTVDLHSREPLAMILCRLRNYGGPLMRPEPKELRSRFFV
jgi:hypothetical protein